MISLSRPISRWHTSYSSVDGSVDYQRPIKHVIVLLKKRGYRCRRVLDRKCAVAVRIVKIVQSVKLCKANIYYGTQTCIESLTCGNHSCSTGGKHSLYVCTYKLCTVCHRTIYVQFVGTRGGSGMDGRVWKRGDSEGVHTTIILKCCLDCTGAHLLTGRIIKKVWPESFRRARTY